MQVKIIKPIVKSLQKIAFLQLGSAGALGGTICFAGGSTTGFCYGAGTGKTTG